MVWLAFLSVFIPLGRTWDIIGPITLLIVVIFFMIALLKSVVGMFCNSNKNKVVKMKKGVPKLEAFLKSA